ncbi:MAG: OmpA family protein [Candidatus Electrothrix sp. ATG2]|nr:OmpA family protein [Candidatus Electrothrix sp. ATG2]
MVHSDGCQPLSTCAARFAVFLLPGFRTVILLLPRPHDTYSSRIQLIGHTDAAGSRGYNRALSMRRAYSAARYLTQVHGIPPQRIIPIGMGEDQLLDPYNPLSGVNRRVEIVVVTD